MWKTASSAVLVFACAAVLALPARAAAATVQDTTDTAAIPAQVPGVVQAQDSSTAVPVVVRGDTVVLVRTRSGAFTAVERADAIASRLRQLARAADADQDSVRTVEVETGIDIVLNDVVIMSVTNADAAAAGLPLQQLATENAAAISQALASQGLIATLETIGLGLLFALLVAAATFLIFRLVQRLYLRLTAAVERGRETWVPAIRFQRLELLSAGGTADALLGFMRVLRLGLLALLLYITIPTVLSFFPWTAAYADQLFGYITSPFARVWAAFLAYLPDLFTSIVIVVVTFYMLKLVRLFFTGIRRGAISFHGFYRDWAMPTYKLVRTMVLLFALIMIWPYLPGSDSPAFQGVGVIFGLLISFGSASAVGNIIGGVVLTYMRPFKVGDRVRISDTTGDVIERNLLVTRVRTIKNVDITIPNAMVLGAHIVNYSATASGGGVILHTTVTIGYDAPWREVHELLISAAKQTEGILADPSPFVLQTGLDDFYVRYELNAYTNLPNRMAAIYSDLHANVQDAFNDAGVEIMSPHYRAARDGNAAAMPPDALPRDYEPPAFRVDNIRHSPG